ncbi:hypothetical protein NMY22_g3293 [Coprinellus aureogranulatus]|nr:hypothetical protein NMY22_g3293 [Coprinellus aureogranulatus]
MPLKSPMCNGAYPLHGLPHKHCYLQGDRTQASSNLGSSTSVSAPTAIPRNSTSCRLVSPQTEGLRRKQRRGAALPGIPECPYAPEAIRLLDLRGTVQATAGTQDDEDDLRRAAPPAESVNSVMMFKGTLSSTSSPLRMAGQSTTAFRFLNVWMAWPQSKIDASFSAPPMYPPVLGHPSIHCRFLHDMFMHDLQFPSAITGKPSATTGYTRPVKELCVQVDRSSIDVSMTPHHPKEQSNVSYQCSVNHPTSTLAAGPPYPHPLEGLAADLNNPCILPMYNEQPTKITEHHAHKYCTAKDKRSHVPGALEVNAFLSFSTASS